jgi:multicomponent Na+:H+ antiporter subunit D
MPQATLFAAIGFLAMAAAPFTSGFVTKPLISSAAAGADLTAVSLMLVAGSAGVTLVGLKFVWSVFFNKDCGLRPKEPPLQMRAAMLLLALICLLVGCAPSLLYAVLPFPVAYQPYSGGHVITQLQLLLFSGLAFFLALRWLERSGTITLDLDWLWRSGGMRFAGICADRMSRSLAASATRGTAAAAGCLRAINRYHGPGGVLARTWPTGIMAFWATLLLAAYLWLYYL